MHSYLGIASLLNQVVPNSYPTFMVQVDIVDSKRKLIHTYYKKRAESEKNQKLYKNILRAYAITKTDYFCVIDPDDFWIDELKIQKALSFLEANKDYAIYATGTSRLELDGTITPFITGELQDSNFEDYLNCKAQLGHTLGSVFRNVIFKNGIPKSIDEFTSNSKENSFRGDSFRSIIHLHEGKCHFVPEVDGIYRMTNDGLWQDSVLIQHELLNCFFYIDMFKYYGSKYTPLFIRAYILYSQGIMPHIAKEIPMILNKNERTNIVKKIKEAEQIFKKISEMDKNSKKP